MPQQGDPFGVEGLDSFRRPVRASVVDDDDLDRLGEPFGRHRIDALQQGTMHCSSLYAGNTIWIIF